MQLQLTYIPPAFWVNPRTGFKILSPNAPPPPHSIGFFFLWLPEREGTDKEKVAKLEDLSRKTFPQIPITKLITAQIRLALPTMEEPHNSASEIKYVQVSHVTGKILPLPPAIKVLFRLPVSQPKQRDRRHTQPRYSDSVKSWAYLVKLTIELLNRGNFLPYLEPISEKSTEGRDKTEISEYHTQSAQPTRYEGQWRVLLKTYRDHARYHALIQQSPWAAYNLPIQCLPDLKLVRGNQSIQASHAVEPSDASHEYVTKGLWHPSFLYSQVMDAVGDYLIRSSLDAKFHKQFLLAYGLDERTIGEACISSEDLPWEVRFLEACISKNRIFQIEQFCDTPIPSILRTWVQNTQVALYSLGLIFTLRLEHPQSKEGHWNIKFFIQPAHQTVDLIPLADVWEGYIAYREEYKNVCSDENQLQEELLRALGLAARLFPPIARSLETRNPDHVSLELNEVMEFLRQYQYLLAQAGFKIDLPDEFKTQGEQKLTARLVLTAPPSNVPTEDESFEEILQYSTDTLIDFSWEAQLGAQGEPLTAEEFQEIIGAESPLVFWRGKWILIDPQDMATLRPIFETKTQIQGKMGYTEALKLGLSQSIQVHEDGSQFEVVLEGAFRSLIQHLQTQESLPSIPVPQTFQGKLRPYQEIALTWLGHMTAMHFGVCLADDMGLGKTIEVIAFLLHRKYAQPMHPGSILIICPTSVLFNWARELRKFAPSLEVRIHHGPQRPKAKLALKEYAVAHRVILTTFGTVRNDIELFDPISFAGVIVDESQNIKNYSTQQTRAIHKLKAQFRLALSGTPIENRLMELWTLYQFLNPGMFGSVTDFRKKFILPIERFQDEATAKKLQRLLSPFLLRRLKSDKSIISDLPEKNEMKIYLTLSTEQKRVYSTVVSNTLQQVESLPTTDPKRRGLILGLLTHTKQICNHPFQYEHGNPEDLVFSQGVKKAEKSSEIPPFHTFIQASVKLVRLFEMIEEILEEGEKILIFTQFRQMGEILKKVLEHQYDFHVGWFHGGVPEKQRRNIVDDFQSTSLESSPILLVSLKAGGTGLNLTQASTVFHFDRWWNPAVENQATDRAYRIGQTKNVMVYKFIAVGTIEEKIDAMLEEKKSLADSILATTGESWITKMSNEDLREMFALSADPGGYYNE